MYIPYTINGTLGYARTSFDSIAALVLRKTAVFPLDEVNATFYLEKAHAINVQRHELVAQAALQKDVLAGTILSGILFC